MIKFVIAVWISGITQFGDYTEDMYQIVIYEPHFDSRASCEMYALQAQDRWFVDLSKKALATTNWIGVVMDEEPVCLPFNLETKELYDGPEL